MAFSLLGSVDKAGLNTFTSDPVDSTGADLLVAVFARQGGSSATLTDSKSNTWLLAIQSNDANGRIAIYYAKNPTVGTNHTFTLTGTGIAANLTVSYYSGADTSSPLDQTNSATGGGVTSLQPGSVTPTTNDQLIVAGVGGSNASGHTVDSGMSEISDTPFSGGSHYGKLTAYKIQTTAAAINPTFSGSDLTSAAIATFKAAAGGGGATYTLTVTSGSAALTGQSVSLQYNRVLSVTSGSLTLSGQSVTLTYSAAAPTLKLFPDSLMSGLTQQPSYITDIIQGKNLREQRTSVSSEARRIFDVRKAIQTRDNALTLIRFFHTCKGQWKAFYLWDKFENEYSLTATADSGNGSRTAFQMRMSYTDDFGDVVYRTIRRPKENTVEVRVNGALQTETTHYTVAYSTGIITFVTPPASGATVTQKCQFYTKVRFMNPSLPASLIKFVSDSDALVEIEPIPLIELIN